jgi:hypothetical protein
MSTVDRLTRELEAAKTRARLAEATAKRAAERMHNAVKRNHQLCDDVKALKDERKRFISLLRRWDKVVYVNKLLGRELPDLVVDLGEDTADAIGKHRGEEIE